MSFPEIELSPHLHICICTFEYGTSQGPEGICTRRLAEALHREGARVTVITSEKAETTSGEQVGPKVIAVSSQPFCPVLLWHQLEKILCNWRLFGNNYHFFWQARVWLQRLPEGVNVIYGRSMPLSGCLAAWRLARKNRLPLFIHFSDPVLSPWYRPAPMPLRLLRRYYRKLVSAATGISFVTTDAIAYSEQTMKISLAGKAFVLPHVGPAPMRLGHKSGETLPVFLYAGRFYGARTPEKLLAGFAKFLERSPGAIFRFLGAQPESINPEAFRLGVSGSVEILPFTRDVSKAFGEADVLVALDAFEGAPVFMSTKIIEYLSTDRPVLLLSPRNSPASRLVSRFPGTALSVGNDAEDIASAMENLLARSRGDEAFQRRFKAMEEFSPSQVARSLIGAIEAKGGGPGGMTA